MLEYVLDLLKNGVMLVANVHPSFLVVAAVTRTNSILKPSVNRSVWMLKSIIYELLNVQHNKWFQINYKIRSPVNVSFILILFIIVPKLFSNFWLTSLYCSGLKTGEMTIMSKIAKTILVPCTWCESSDSVFDKLFLYFNCEYID